MVKKKKSQSKKSHVFTKKELPHIDEAVLTSETSVKPPKSHVDRELAQIYGNSDGTIPDMKHFAIKKRHRLLTAIVVLCLSLGALGAVAWFGFFFMQPNNTFVEDDVILSVSSPETVTIGQDIQFRIRYKNAGAVPMAKAVIQAHYPEGFVFDTASITPVGEGKNQWEIGSLNRDDGGYIDISGKLYGDIGSEYSVRVFMNYTPGNFTSEFQKVAHVALKLHDSPVVMNVEMPKDILQGVEVPLTITLKQAGEKRLPAGKYAVVFDPRGIFTKTKSNPKSDAVNEYQWTVNPAEAEKSITMHGMFTLPEGAKPEFVISLVGQPSEAKDKKFVFAEKSMPVTVAAADITVQAIVNGSAGTLHTQPGEKLFTRLVVRNNGKTPLKNTKIRLQLDVPAAQKNSIIDWTNIVDETDGDVLKGEQISDTMRRGQIIWSGKQIAALGSLAPGKEAVVDLEIPIKNAAEIDLGTVSAYKGELKADFQYDAGTGVQIVSGNPVQIIFQSDISVETEADIEANKAVVSWVIKNSFHELKDIQIRTDFFGEINPDQKTVFSPPAGTVSFDEKTRSLLWKIDTLPLSVDVLSYEFFMNIIKLNTSQTQLTGKIQFEALDTVTGEKLLKVLNQISLQ
jgi:uncharacterized repeat protein (TIGR01451 family)